mgnify:FL=1
MAGRDGARGYVYQALVAVFKCFQYDSWNQIKVEPLTNNDKVDILLKKDEVLIKAIQVKSSVNKFEKPDIEKWIDEIKKDIKAMDYELVLVGDSLTKPATEFIQKNNNDKKNHVYIEIIEGGERGIEKLTKNYVLEFLECYNPESSISVNQIDDIANKIFAKLMKISTNENWFSKNDLINTINRNMTSNTSQKKMWHSIKRVILGIVCVAVFYISIYVSKGYLIPMLCVVFSDVVVAVIWGLLKYSDIHFWKNLWNDNELFSSLKYGSECRSIAVNINKDDISHKQKVYIENLLAERIDIIEGKIKFFSGNTEKNHIAFKTIDIDSGREVKIDEIAYDTDREYGDKTYWNEVELHIDNIVSKDSRACVWSGTVIKFSRIYNFDQFNYLRLGEIRILPYEITWFKNEIVQKIWRYINILLTVYLGGYDRNNFWKHIKIKVIGFCGRLIHRFQGVLLLCLIIAVILGVLYGQLYWMIKFIRYIF